MIRSSKDAPGLSTLFGSLHAGLFGTQLVKSDLASFTGLTVAYQTWFSLLLYPGLLLGLTSLAKKEASGAVAYVPAAAFVIQAFLWGATSRDRVAYDPLLIPIAVLGWETLLGAWLLPRLSRPTFPFFRLPLPRVRSRSQLSRLSAQVAVAGDDPGRDCPAIFRRSGIWLSFQGRHGSSPAHPTW